jgi:3-methyladenine DNA glycosylase/8-oxoguanine DNA glycosylase
VAARLTKAHTALAASDPVMAALIDRYGPTSPRQRRRFPRMEPFAELTRIVVFQQVSTAAGRSIWAKLCAATAEPPTVETVLGAGHEVLRGAGLSGRKAEYVHGLAEVVASGDVDLETLESLADDDVIELITSIRGFGRWSAEMLLIFHLERPDILAPNDIGIRRGLQFALELEEMPSEAEVAERAALWKPHRTLASMYLWSIAGDGVPA